MKAKERSDLLFVLTRHKNRVEILIIFITIARKKLGVE